MQISYPRLRLEACSRASNYNSTRIFLITDNDDPLRHEGGAQLQAAAKTRANVRLPA